MSEYGANLIVLGACRSCGMWPYSHKPDCPVAIRKLADRMALADLMSRAAVSSSPEPTR